jgi:transposase InsO family protein
MFVLLIFPMIVSRLVMDGNGHEMARTAQPLTGSCWVSDFLGNGAEYVYVTDLFSVAVVGFRPLPHICL